MTDDPYATLRAIIERFEHSGVPYMIVPIVICFCQRRRQQC